ncbi:MAG: HAMP domain-containing sensor histidine kinase [Myxococcota bacterium]
MAATDALHAPPHGFDVDRIYAVLRVVSLAAGVAYAFVSLGPGLDREAALFAFGGFVVYSVLLYAVGFGILRTGAKPTFYVAAAALDLLFVALLMRLTGDAQSPFYRALYLWIAMFAFYFGRLGGMVASLLALIVFGGFHIADRFAGDPWVLGVQAGGMLMHGPLIGYLVDLQRRRAHDLAEAHRRLREEQAKLVQTEKLSSIGLLASGVAHEVNNPLQGVMACAKALREGGLSDERRAEYEEAVRDGLDRIRVTVQGLLDYARERKPAPTDLDVADVAAACARLVAPATRRKDVRVDLRVAEGEARVYADRSQLMQALLNVLLNAAYAAPDGSAVEVSAAARDGLAGIRVADRGPGIPKDIVDRVCDPFFTTKPEGRGTGLGLSVTLGIVRAHGGDLEIRSEEGHGTTVTLWLPARGEADARPPAG